MPLRDIDDLEKLKKINAALVSRVERSMDQQGNAFSLFQTAISLENRVRNRTEELHATLRRLEQTNIDLSAAKENAELANLSKTRFLAAASQAALGARLRKTSSRRLRQAHRYTMTAIVFLAIGHIVLNSTLVR